MRQAESSRALDAMGRGMMKKYHPHEIRIPDVLNSFSGQLCPGTETSRSSGPLRPLRGRGRGSQLLSSPSSLSQPRPSSRDKRIRQSLDAKKMDIQEGKGFIMEKFLGLQTEQHLHLKEQGAHSQSSGFSRRTCPAKLGFNRSEREEWPYLKGTHSGPNSLLNQRTNSQQSNNLKREEEQPKQRAGDKRPDTAIHRSLSDGNFSARNHTSEGPLSKSTDEAVQCMEKFDESSPDSRQLSTENSGLSKADNSHDGKRPAVAMNGMGYSDVDDECGNGNEVGTRSNINGGSAEGIRRSTEPNRENGTECRVTKTESIEQNQAAAATSDLADDVIDAEQPAPKLSLSDLGQSVAKSRKDDDPQAEKDAGKDASANEEEINYRLFVAPNFQPGDLSPLAGPNVLQVEGLPPSITDEEVTDLFLMCGAVTACKVLRDADTKLCIGVAYVRLEESSSCTMAVSSFNDELSPFADHHEDDDIPCLKVQLFNQS